MAFFRIFIILKFSARFLKKDLKPVQLTGTDESVDLILNQLLPFRFKEQAMPSVNCPCRVVLVFLIQFPSFFS